MSQPPAPFDRSWSFTDFSQSNPTTPHQGQKIDQELNNARTAINATISRLGEIQADDGKVRTTALNLAVIAEEVEPLLTDAPVQAVEAAGAAQIGLVNDAGDAKVAELEAVLTSQNAIDALAARDDAEIARDVAEASAILAQGYSDTASGYATTALQAKNSALVHANTAEAAVSTIQAANYASYHHTHAISNVTGLQSALDGKYSVNNPDGYITSSALTGYATQAWVNGRGFLTSVPAGYATEAFVTSQGYITSAPSFDGGTLSQGAAIVMSDGTNDSEVGGWGFGVELTGSVNQLSTVEYNRIFTKNADYYFSASPDIVKVFESTNELGVTIAHDSVTIQHIDTPDQTAYFTNEYIGFEDMGATPHSAWIEHDVITVQDVSGMTQIRATGVTFPDATTQATAAATNNTQLATTVAGDGGMGYRSIVASDANTVILAYSTVTFYLNDDANGPFPIGAQVVFVNMSSYTMSFAPSNYATIHSADNLLNITKQWGTAVAIKVASNEWVLSGNLA
jgi:hypothetical protein